VAILAFVFIKLWREFRRPEADTDEGGETSAEQEESDS
jgi:hypothetical protein